MPVADLFRALKNKNFNFEIFKLRISFQSLTEMACSTASLTLPLSESQVPKPNWGHCSPLLNCNFGDGKAIFH